MKESKNILSIIIPAYNAEAYIAKCLDCIIPLLEYGIQVIVVNDGSKDNTALILGKYSKSFPDIEVITQENGGVSAARNAGMRYISGEFVCFVDADDYIDTEQFANVLKYLQNNRQEQLFVFSHYEGNSSEGYVLVKHDRLLYEKDSLDSLYECVIEQQLNEPWEKIYRSDILKKNSVCFPTNLFLGEDICMFIDYLNYIDTYEYIDIPYYYYYKNSSGATASVKLTFFEQEIVLHEKMYKLITEKNLDQRMAEINNRLLLHKTTRYVSSLVSAKLSSEKITHAIERSGVGQVLSNCSFSNKVDLIRNRLLLKRRYWLLNLILSVFKGK